MTAAIQIGISEHIYFWILFVFKVGNFEILFVSISIQIMCI